MRKLSHRILNWSNNMISFPDIPTISSHCTDYLSSIQPAKVKLRSAEEDMQIVAEDISQATAEVLARYGDDRDNKRYIKR